MLRYSSLSYLGLGLIANPILKAQGSQRLSLRGECPELCAPVVMIVIIMKRRRRKTLTFVCYYYPSLDDFDYHFDLDLDFHVLLFLTLAFHLQIISTCTIVTGNFPTVTRVLLAKIPPSDGRMIYNFEDYVVSEKG